MADASCHGRHCYFHLGDGVEYHDAYSCPVGHDGPPDPHGLVKPSPQKRAAVALAALESRNRLDVPMAGVKTRPRGARR